MHRVVRGIARSPFLIASLLILMLVMGAATFSRQMAGKDPAKQSLALRLKPPGFVDKSGDQHLFGTDALGRDIYSLIVYGARPGLLVGIGSTLISVALGITVGLIAGYRTGPLSDVLMRVADIQLAFPFFLLAITVVGILGPSLPLVLVIIGLGNWVPYARVIRSEVLELKGRDYVMAARALGANDLYILVRHIFPNNIPSIVVLVSFNLATAIVMEAGLSFVGLGLPGSTPSWGRMLSEGRDYVATAWWLSLAPGLCIFLVVLSINLIGDFVREVIDPKLRT